MPRKVHEYRLERKREKRVYFILMENWFRSAPLVSIIYFFISYSLTFSKSVFCYFIVFFFSQIACENCEPCILVYNTSFL